MLHAWAESLGSFDRLLPLLPPGIRVLAPDQRGHGHADKPRTGYALADFARDAVAFLDEVGLESAVLLGSSSGGYVAQQVAFAHPHRVAGLLLVGSPRSLRGRPPFADDVGTLTDPVDPAWVRRFLEWIPLLTEVPRWYLEDRVRDGVRMPAAVWQESLIGLSTALPPTEAGVITAPTLIISGASDRLLPEGEGRALATAIAGSRLIEYEHTGHLVLWEHPERVASDTVDFVRNELG